MFFLQPVGVTLYTFLEIRDAFVSVFFLDISGPMLVAAVAGVGLQTFNMTRLTCIRAAFTMIDRENVGLTILGRTPCVRSMTGSAILSEQSLMIAWLCMAARALPRCPSVLLTGMALDTINLRVLASKRKTEQKVVEHGFFPGLSCVALGAVLPKATIMGIVLEMTIRTLN